MTSNFDDEYL